MPQRLALDLKASNLNLDNLLTDTPVADAPGLHFERQVKAVKG
jgi:AsmA protein